MSVTVTLEDAQLRRALARLSARLGDLSGPMEEIGQALVTDVDLAFREQRDPWGDAWRALSDVTLRRRRGTSAQILSDSRRLAGSINYRAGRDSVEVGSNVVYAAMQHFGGRKSDFSHLWGDIPARPFLPVDPVTGEARLADDTRDEVAGIVAAHLEAALG